jgi:hypothetical protein
MPLTFALTTGVKDELHGIASPEELADIPYLETDFERALSYLTEAQPWLSEAERLRHRALFLDMAEAVHKMLVRAQTETLRHGVV